METRRRRPGARVPPAALIALGVLLAACGTTGSTDLTGRDRDPTVAGVVNGGGKKAPEPPPDLADEIIALYGPPIDDPRLLEHVRELTEALARAFEQQGEEPRDWFVLVLDSPRTLHFSTPSGEILLCRGLLEAEVLNDAMLAGVLAHEMAHVNDGHLDGAVRTAFNRRVPGASVPALASAEYRTTILDVLMPSGVDGITFQYRKAQEQAAAVAAIEAVCELGYDPVSVTDLLRSLADLVGRVPEAKIHRIETIKLLPDLEAIALERARSGCRDVGRESYVEDVLERLALLDPAEDG